MRLIGILGSLAFCALAAGRADAQGAAPKAQVAFLAGGGLSGGAYHAAIVIELAPDTTTYWRNPGEAGSPPTFDFSGSANLSDADVAMPAPSRIEEAGSDVFGFRTRVAFPVSIRPDDAGKPVRAKLKMDYAACEKICMPMHAEAEIDLKPDAVAGPNASVIAAAEAAVPKRVAADAAVTLAPVAGADKPSWIVTPRTAGASDLFPEAPEGYFAETKRLPDGAFRLSLVETPAGKPVPQAPVRLTLATASGALEFSVRLDATGAKP